MHFLIQQSRNKQFILRAILGKLTTRTLVLIGSRIELKSWIGIRNALDFSFGDQRNMDCLLQDLIILPPDKNDVRILEVLIFQK